MMTTKQEAELGLAVLREAVELLDSGKRWTVGASGRYPDGRPAPCYAAGAVSFCLYGAVSRAASILYPPVAMVEAAQDAATDLLHRQISNVAGRRVGPCGIVFFNDRQGSYEPVGAALAGAIAIAEGIIADAEGRS